MIRRHMISAYRHFCSGSLPTLHVTLREKMGSRHSRLIRSEKMVPGVIYGPSSVGKPNGPAIKVQIAMKDIQKQARLYGNSLENRFYELHLTDSNTTTTHKVVLRQFQICSYTETPLAVNYLRYQPGVKMRIPINFTNEEDNIDVKRGCFVVPLNKFLTCRCSGDIPLEIEVDVSKAKKGEVIKVSEISLPAGVVPIFSGKATDCVLCKVESG